MAVTTTIEVKEIHCEGCEHVIRTALSQLNGVLSVAPSRENNQVTVSYDELALNEANLKERLVEIGYEPIR